MKTSYSGNNDTSTSTDRAPGANGIGTTPRKNLQHKDKSSKTLEPPFISALEAEANKEKKAPKVTPAKTPKSKMYSTTKGYYDTTSDDIESNDEEEYTGPLPGTFEYEDVITQQRVINTGNNDKDKENKERKNEKENNNDKKGKR
jgi:hypothetical protein